MILIIDNYDSFTYNLYQMVARLTDKVLVVRNDAISIDEIRDKLDVKGIILSPGPKYPTDAGICIEVIKEFGKTIPILGVCLGHQAIGVAYGGVVKLANKPIHGAQSLIFHDRSSLFRNLPLPFRAGRYHSLIVDRDTLPIELKIDGEDVEGNVMAISHREFPVFGIQFHPESILTPEGHLILKNFIEIL